MSVEKTFAHDDSLPSLPIPDLKNTLTLYLTSVEALLAADDDIDENERQHKQAQLANTKRIVGEFLNGTGRQLHEVFVSQYANKKNWLEELWLYAYLSMRESSALWINYGGPKRLYPLVTRMDVACDDDIQPWNGALFIFLLVEYWRLLRTGTAIATDKNSRKEPLSMHQYRCAFNACRRPGVEVDSYISAFRTVEESATCPSTIIVCCNGRLFRIDPLGLNPIQIYQLLCKVRRQAYADGPGHSLAAMTYANRNDWAKLHSWLSDKSKRNAENFTIIEESLCVLALDPTEPKDDGSAIWRSLYGDPSNRWADKPASYVIYANGRLTTNCEHTPLEGIIHVVIGYHIDTVLLPQFGGIKGLMSMKPNTGAAAVAKMRDPEELVFDEVETELARQHISKVLSDVQLFASDIRVACSRFELFGTKYLSPYGLSTDVICQLVMQLAYMRSHGRPAPVYKTASTRRFFHGRTETIRSCSPAVVKFCRSVLGTAAGRRLASKEQWKLFKEAHADHIRLTSVCSRGNGADRHLLMLQAIAAKSGTTSGLEIFSDQSWQMAGGNGSFKLSSSYTGDVGEGGCCAPMCRGGYGVFYSSCPDWIGWIVTFFQSDRPKTNGLLYIQNLEWALCRLKSLIDDHGEIVGKGNNTNNGNGQDNKAKKPAATARL